MFSELHIFFDRLLKLVSEVSGIPVRDILKSNEIDAVDARNVVVYVLHNQGVYCRNIAKLVNRTPRAVRYILSNFDNRCDNSKYMRSIYEDVRKKIGNNFEIEGK